MKPEAAYLAELQATERPILRRHCLQRASNDLPPGALTRLYLQLPNLGGRALCKMAPEYRFMTGRARCRAAQRPQLEKQPGFGAHAFYKTCGQPHAKKTLFIMFCGHYGEFFIPLSVLLAVLPKGPKDVMAVRSGFKNMFLAGIEGLGHSAFEVANTLRRQLQTEAYNRVVLIGLSASGIFSLRVAAFLAPDVMVSFAAVYPDEAPRLKAAIAAGETGFDPICACRPTQAGRLINVVATKNESDLLYSLRLKNSRPGLLEFHLVNSTSHNVLKSMLKAGYAAAFMRVAMANNGAAIWALSSLSRAYGLGVVRKIRQALGLQ